MSNEIFTTSIAPAPKYGFEYLSNSGVVIAPRKKKGKPRLVLDGNYTIYHNEYGDKTVVKKIADEPNDPEKAACYAVLKSMGIQPKFINDLVANAFDAKAKREKKRAKVEEARRKKAEQEG